MGGDAADADVLNQMRADGIDLSLPRELRYYLYVPTQADANALAAAVSGGGRQVGVEPAALGSDWLVLVTESTVVDLATLAARREEFTRAVQAYGGEYYGWEAAAVP